MINWKPYYSQWEKLKESKLHNEMTKHSEQFCNKVQAISAQQIKDYIIRYMKQHNLIVNSFIDKCMVVCDDIEVFLANDDTINIKRKVQIRKRCKYERKQHRLKKILDV